MLAIEQFTGKIQKFSIFHWEQPLDPALFFYSGVYSTKPISIIHVTALSSTLSSFPFNPKYIASFMKLDYR